MKITKKGTKIFALFISVLMLFQSCKVYYKDPISIEQAVAEHKNIKIKTHTNQTLKFNNIIFEDGNYYGEKKLKKGIDRKIIIVEDIQKIQVQNKTMSTLLSIGSLLVFTIGIYFLNFALTFNMFGA